MVEQGAVTVKCPPGVVIPPGYECHYEVHHVPRLRAVYKVVKMRGWYAAYLRWRFPWRTK